MSVWKKKAALNKEALLAAAIAAGSIALGGIACQNPASPEPNIGGNDIDSTQIIDTTATDTTKTDSTQIPERDFSGYTQYMGRTLLVGWADSKTPLPSDTIGWAEIYTENGWEPRGSTRTCVVFPNGYKGFQATGLTREYVPILFDKYSVPGYEGLIIVEDKTTWEPAEPSQNKANELEK